MQLFVYPLPPPTLACVPILWCPPIRIAVCALVFFFFFFWTHFILEYKPKAKPSCNYELLHL
jgi:hypothetical protein